MAIRAAAMKAPNEARIIVDARQPHNRCHHWLVKDPSHIGDAPHDHQGHQYHQYSRMEPDDNVQPVNQRFLAFIESWSGDEEWLGHFSMVPSAMEGCDCSSQFQWL